MLNPMPKDQDIPRMDQMLSTKQVMQILNKDRSTVTRYGQDGKIRMVGRLPGDNGAILWDRASVEALAAEIADQMRQSADDLQQRAAR
jgi:predicted site-specific integrase-resolvase